MAGGARRLAPDHLPDLRERLHGYAEKAMREAGDRTTWTEPDEAYEAAVHAAVDAVFDADDVRAVLVDLAARIDEPALANSLAAKLLALTMPGVPDVYQGSELWETSLVDPDNRRPVDFDHRAAVLAGTAEDDAADQAARHLHRADAAPRAARAVHRLRAGAPPPGPPPATWSPSTAAARSPSPPGSPSGSPRPAAGATPRSTCPTGRWHDVLTGLDTDGRLADLLAVHPVALLVQEGLT